MKKPLFIPIVTELSWKKDRVNEQYHHRQDRLWPIFPE